MTLIQAINQGNVSFLLCFAVIVAAALTMMWFFNRELKKNDAAEKKNDQSVVSIVQNTGNDAVAVAISAAVNEYRKK